jgi:hypothetical protein
MEDVCYTQYNGYLGDQSQLTSRLIVDIIQNQLRENLEMTVKEARGLIK